MTPEKGLLIVLSGPSGCGKGTVLARLLQNDAGTAASISATTRAPREGEQDGVHYYFITREDFESRIRAGEMLEYASYCGNYYGTPKDAVQRLREQGTNVILEIELQGAMKVKRSCPDALFVFIMPPSLRTLRERLTGRGTEDAATVESRLEVAKGEIAQADQYDYIIVNDTVEKAAEQLQAVLLAEQIKSVCKQKLIDEVLNNA